MTTRLTWSAWTRCHPGLAPYHRATVVPLADIGPRYYAHSFFIVSRPRDEGVTVIESSVSQFHHDIGLGPSTIQTTGCIALAETSSLSSFGLHITTGQESTIRQKMHQVAVNSSQELCADKEASQRLIQGYLGWASRSRSLSKSNTHAFPTAHEEPSLDQDSSLVNQSHSLWGIWCQCCRPCTLESAP